MTDQPPKTPSPAHDQKPLLALAEQEQGGPRWQWWLFVTIAYLVTFAFISFLWLMVALVLIMVIALITKLLTGATTFPPNQTFEIVTIGITVGCLVGAVVHAFRVSRHGLQVPTPDKLSMRIGTAQQRLRAEARLTGSGLGVGAGVIFMFLSLSPLIGFSDRLNEVAKSVYVATAVVAMTAIVAGVRAFAIKQLDGLYAARLPSMRQGVAVQLVQRAAALQGAVEETTRLADELQEEIAERQHAFGTLDQQVADITAMLCQANQQEVQERLAAWSRLVEPDRERNRKRAFRDGLLTNVVVAVVFFGVGLLTDAIGAPDALRDLIANFQHP
ncbi:hypothetical protein [Nonomuraea fuscirosea]|uniref:hypothetical protein n=1 Tax=Nonomuraea fuscirosea TaxID=1291556 RepID=UPI0033DF3597